jgi:DNA repair exonuclease SbcCD ATPase subunit
VIDQAKVENLKKELNSANKLITTIKSIVDNYSTHADSADKIQAALKKAIDELNSAERQVEAAVYNGYSGGYGEAGTGGTGGGGTGGGGMSDDQKAQLRDNLKNNIDWGDSANQHDKDAL